MFTKFIIKRNVLLNGYTWSASSSKNHCLFYFFIYAFLRWLKRAMFLLLLLF